MSSNRQRDRGRTPRHPNTAGLGIPEPRTPSPSDEHTAALAAIYDSLPVVQCQGKCQAACAPLYVHVAEYASIAASVGAERAAGGRIALDVVGTGGNCSPCPFLTTAGRCDIYEIRPMVCRVYGAVDTPQMTCGYGCPIVDRTTGEPVPALTMEQATALYARLIAKTGSADIASFHTADEWRKFWHAMQQERDMLMRRRLASNPGYRPSAADARQFRKY